MRILSLIKEASYASQQAKSLNLRHVGWGKYSDQTGQVVAKSVGGRLVFLQPKPQPSVKQPVAKSATSPEVRKGLLAFTGVGGRKNKANINLNAIGLYNEEKVDKFVNIMDKNGFALEDKKPILGQGTFGVAFALKNGTVMKVTTDVTETKSAMKVKKHPHPNIAKYFDFYSSPRFTKKYFINMEKLVDVDNGLQDLGYEEFDRGQIERILDGQVMSDLAGKITDEDISLEDYSDIAGDPIDEFWNTETPRSWEEYKKILLPLCDALFHLQKLGVQFGDVHTGNVMYDPKTKQLKFIDMGVGSDFDEEPVPKELKEVFI
jgi:hypothetical protein